MFQCLENSGKKEEINYASIFKISNNLPRATTLGESPSPQRGDSKKVHGNQQELFDNRVSFLFVFHCKDQNHNNNERGVRSCIEICT